MGGTGVALPVQEQVDTVTVTGSVNYTDGSDATGWKVLFDDGPSSPPTIDHTDSSGQYNVSLNASETYPVWFQQFNNTYNATENYVRDGRIDLYAIGNVSTGASDVDMGNTELPDPNLLNVQVVDGNGDPMNGVFVRVFHVANGIEAQMNTETNSNGYVYAGNVSEPGVEVTGTIRLEVSGPQGYTSNYSTIEVTGDRNYTVELTAEKQVNGTIETADGSAVGAGDDVELMADGDGQLDATDSNGNFSIGLTSNGTYGLQYYQDGFQTTAPADGIPDIYAFGNVSVSGDTDLGTRTLPEGHNLTINVQKSDGTPVANTSVQVSHDSGENTVYTDITTDSQGQATIEVNGSTQLFVDAGDLGVHFSSTTVTSDESVNITFQSSNTVTGTVEAANGTGVGAGDTVELMSPDYTRYENDTDSNGSFSTTVPTNETYELMYYQNGTDTEAAADGIPDVYAFGNVSVSGDTDIGTRTLPEGHNLTITLESEDGTPVTNTSLWVGHDPDPFYASTEITTDSEGTATIEVTGPVSIYVPQTGNLDNTNKDVAVTGDQSVTLTMQKTVTVNGTVSDHTGSPVYPMRIIYSSDDGVSDGAWTYSSGSYELGLQPNTSYHVLFSQENTDTVLPNDGVPDVYVAEMASVGSTNQTNDIQLPKGHDLNVTVVDENGDPLSGVGVLIQADRNNYGTAVDGTTNADGLFVGDGASHPGIEVNGSIDVEVNQPPAGYAEKYVDVTVTNSTNVTVTLVKTMNVTGTIEGADGTPATSDFLRVSNFSDPYGESVWTDSNGSFSAAIAEGGPYEVEFRQTAADGDWQGSFPQDGIPDVYYFGTVNQSTKDMGTLTLPEPHNLTVRVQDRKGNPVSNVELEVDHELPGVDGDGDSIAWTDSNGEVHAEVIGRIDLYADGRDRGYKTNFTEVTVDSDRTVTLTIAAVANLSGSIEYADGTVPEGYIASFDGDESYGSDRVSTDGSFTAAVGVNDTYDVEFDQRDWQGEHSPFPKDGKPDVYVFDAPVTVGTSDQTIGTWTLPDAPHLVNVTVTNETGAVLEGIDVSLGYENNGSTTWVSGTTDTNGDVRLYGAPPGIELAAGNLSVNVYGDDLGYDNNYTDYTIDSDRNLTIELESVKTVTGRFVDEQGDPLVEDGIIVVGEDSSFDYVRTDAQGTFDFDMPAGNYSLVFSQDNFSTELSGVGVRDGVADTYEFASLNLTSSTDLGNVTIPDGHVLDPKVVDESGNPVEDAEVLYYPNASGGVEGGGIILWTLSDGRVHGLENLTDPAGLEVAGPVKLTVREPDNSTRFKDQEITNNLTVTSNMSPTITLAEENSAVVEGTLTLSNGSDASGDLVTVFNESDLQTNNTDDTGQYSFEITENDTYWLGYYQLRNGSYFLRDGNVDIFEFGSVNETDTATVNATLPAGHVVDVTALDESGDPVPNASLTIWANQSRPSTGWRTNTTQNGILNESSSGTGIELSGAVKLEAQPPENATRFLNETTVRNITVTGPMSVEITLPEKQANFSTDFSVNATEVLTTEAVEVNATVTNDGPVVGSTSVEFERNGSVVNTTTVDLAAGETTTVTYNMSLDRGDNAVSVNGLSPTTVTALAPANLSTSFTVDPTTLLPSETVTVTATVENTGDVNGTQEVNVSIDESVVDTQTVTVQGTSTEQVTYETSLDTGEHTVSVNDLTAATVTVQEPANFSTTYSVNETTVLTNESVGITATVENTGDVEGTTSVDFLADDIVIGTQSVTVPAGSSKQVTQTIISMTRGTHNLSVNNLTPTEVTVLAPANFSTTYAVNETSPLTNETVGITATVENTGDVEGTETVEFVIDGTVVDTQQVTVAATSSKTVTYNTTLDRGTHDVTVNGLDPVTVTALAPANVSVDYSVAPLTALTNETVSVSVSVSNSGDVAANQTLNISVDGTVVDSRTKEVAGTSLETYTYDLGTLDRGTHDVTVNGLAATTVTVEAPANISLVSQTVESTDLLSTDPVNVTATLENTGDRNGTTSVDLFIDGSVVATKTVAVAGGQTATVDFTERVYWDSYGDHTVSVGDLAGETITVERPTNPDASVSITAPAAGSVLATGDVGVDYTFTNVDTGIDHAEYRVDDGSWQTVASGSLADGTLSLTGLADGSHTVDIRLIDNLGNAAGSAQTTFTVDTTAPVTAITAGSEVGPQDPVTISVEHTDATRDTTVIEVRDGGSVVTTFDMTDEVDATSGGGVGNATLSWNGSTADGSMLSTGEYTLAVVGTDAAGQQSESTTTITLDRDVPTVSVQSASPDIVAGGDTITVSGTATDDTTNVSTVTVVFDSQSGRASQTTAATLNGDGTWTATLDSSTLPTSGKYTVGAVAIDDLGNGALVTNESLVVALDRTAPSLGLTVGQQSTTTGRVNVTATENLSAAPDVDVTLPNGTVRTVSLSETSAGWTGTFDFGGSGEYAVNATGTDIAGNAGSTNASTTVQTSASTADRTLTITNDKTGTFIELHTTTDVDNAFGALTESEQPLASLSAGLSGARFIDGQLGAKLEGNLSHAIIGIPVQQDDLPAGVDPSDVEIRYFNETSKQWEVVGDTTLANRTIGGTTQQYYLVNVSHFSTYGAVAADTTPPSIDGTSLSSGGPTYDYDTDTVDVTFDYSDTQSGIDTDAVEVYVDGQLVTGSFAGDVQVTSDKVVVSPTGLVGSGTHTVTVKAVDNAGNAAANVTEEFEVTADTTAPTISSGFTNNQTLAYGTSDVTVDVSYTDSQSGIAQDTVSVIFDGSDVTGPATVTSTGVTYDATGLSAGSHTMTVEVTDAAGNTDTLTRAFTIEADTTAPSIDSTALSPSGSPLPANTTEVTFDVSYSDTESGIDASNVVVELDSGSGFTDVTDNAVVTADSTSITGLDLSPGSHTFRVTVPDGDGNEETVTETATIGTGTAPTFGTVDFSQPISDGSLDAGTSQTDITVNFDDVDGDVETITATFDGTDVTASLTETSGAVTYTATGLSDGSSHALNVTLTDAGGNTVSKAVEFSVDQSSGGSGGSTGGGGGGQGDTNTGTIKISEWSVSDSTVAPGEQVTLAVTVVNNADSTKTITPALYVDGELVEGQRISVLKGMERTVEFTYRFSEEGTHSLSPDGSDFEFVTVESAGESTTATPTTTESTQTTTATSTGDEPVPTTGTTVADTTTEPPAGDDADDDGSSSSIPGFGLGPALVALVAAALLAMRRTN